MDLPDPAELPEFGTPEYASILAQCDQQAAMMGRMVDCYVQAAHAIGQMITARPIKAANPYGAEAQSVHGLMIYQSIAEEIPYMDLVMMFSVATARIAEMEARQ